MLKKLLVISIPMIPVVGGITVVGRWSRTPKDTVEFVVSTKRKKCKMYLEKFTFENYVIMKSKC